MKKLVLVILILMATVVNCSAETWSGFVTSAQLSVREAPNTSAKKILTLKTGDVVRVIAEASGVGGENFYKVMKGDKIGYVLKDFVLLSSKEYVTLKDQTNILAFPEGSIVIGQKNAGTQLLRLDEVQYNECVWFIVQPQEGQPGVGFVRSEDCEPEPEPEVEPQSEQPMNGGGSTSAGIPSGSSAIVNCDETAVWTAQDDRLTPIGYIRKGSILRVVRAGAVYTGIAYPYMGQTIVAYVKTEHLVEVLK